VEIEAILRPIRTGTLTRQRESLIRRRDRVDFDLSQRLKYRAGGLHANLLLPREIAGWVKRVKA